MRIAMSELSGTITVKPKKDYQGAKKLPVIYDLESNPSFFSWAKDNLHADQMSRFFSLMLTKQDFEKIKNAPEMIDNDKCQKLADDILNEVDFDTHQVLLDIN